MKRNALKTLTLLCVVLCCGLGSLNAQEQQEKKIAYNFINEYYHRECQRRCYG